MRHCQPPLDSLDDCNDKRSLYHLHRTQDYLKSRTSEVRSATSSLKTVCCLRLPFPKLFNPMAYYNLHSSTPYLLLRKALSSRTQVRSLCLFSALSLSSGVQGYVILIVPKPHPRPCLRTPLSTWIPTPVRRTLMNTRISHSGTNRWA